MKLLIDKPTITLSQLKIVWKNFSLERMNQYKELTQLSWTEIIDQSRDMPYEAWNAEVDRVVEARLHSGTWPRISSFNLIID